MKRVDENYRLDRHLFAGNRRNRYRWFGISIDIEEAIRQLIIVLFVSSVLYCILLQIDISEDL